MKSLKKIILTIVIFFAICVGLRRYAGGFSTITVVEQEMGPYTFAYMSFTGNYYKVGPTMDAVDKFLREEGITAEKGLGIYYDNPAKVPADQLRSDVGSIIETKDIEKLNKNSDKYHIKTIPTSKSVVATFPIKNKLSYMVGPMIVYTKLEQYIIDKGYNSGYQTMELYDIPKKTTYYFVEIQE